MKLINQQERLNTLRIRYTTEYAGITNKSILSALNSNTNLTISTAILVLPELMKIPKCSECHQSFNEVIELGKVWNEKQYYCASCLKKALNLLWYE